MPLAHSTWHVALKHKVFLSSCLNIHLFINYVIVWSNIEVNQHIKNFMNSTIHEGTLQTHVSSRMKETFTEKWFKERCCESEI